jgi:anti-sigma regulatory factor (Ser/Thr protein kinase)
VNGSEPERAARHPEFEHVAVVHDGPAELAELLAPSLRQAVERRHAVLVCAERAVWDELSPLLGSTGGRVQYVPGTTRYSTPVTAVAVLDEFVRTAHAEGAEAVWSVGSIPYGEHDVDAWLRYEAAVCDVLAHLPVKGVCTYDRGALPARIVSTASDSHDAVLDRSGRRAGGCSSHPAPPPPPAPPAVHRIIDTVVADIADIADGRRVLVAGLRGHLDPVCIDELELVASELLTNAVRHGAPPVTFTVWHDPGTSLTTIRVGDRGPGIDDPYFDLRPPKGPAVGGYGLWTASRLSTQMTTARGADGSSVFAVHDGARPARIDASSPSTT